MRTLYWENNTLFLLDQTKLPLSVEYISCRDYRQVASAIRTMQVRGAPAIGAAAAYGVVLGALAYEGQDTERLVAHIRRVAQSLAETRPTAVNLFWALDRMLKKLSQLQTSPSGDIIRGLLAEAHGIYQEDLAMNRRIGEFGNSLVPDKATILTHCNAGALATTGYGTALGVIRAAHEAGKDIRVYADETRPLLQGARLTAWELMQDGIPVTLITDSMAGYLMQQGKIDLVVVGADRITANGDVANKIGTYSLAVLCRHHRVPFYVAAPVSTIDVSLPCGAQIPIEERDLEEVCRVGNQRVAPEGVPVYNPAFDVTPHYLVTALITDRGVIRPPFDQGLAEALKGNI
ncbi:methylthioribose-1-phosphate isomerase [Clostridiales bacterium PH28_bin88]|nr:methylthioribose-1-phosphate isomerase [Clostridiales bacterium PH28_bin88]